MSKMLRKRWEQRWRQASPASTESSSVHEACSLILLGLNNTLHAERVISDDADCRRRSACCGNALQAAVATMVTIVLVGVVVAVVGGGSGEALVAVGVVALGVVFVSTTSKSE